MKTVQSKAVFELLAVGVDRFVWVEKHKFYIHCILFQRLEKTVVCFKILKKR